MKRKISQLLQCILAKKHANNETDFKNKPVAVLAGFGGGGSLYREIFYETFNRKWNWRCD